MRRWKRLWQSAPYYRWRSSSGRLLLCFIARPRSRFSSPLHQAILVQIGWSLERILWTHADLSWIFCFPQKKYGWFPESNPLPKKSTTPHFQTSPWYPKKTDSAQCLFKRKKATTQRFPLPASIPGVFSEFPVDFESKERNSDEDGIQKNDGLEKKSGFELEVPAVKRRENFHQLEIPKTTHSCLTKMVLSYVFQGAVPKTRHPEVKFPMFVQGTHHLFGGVSMF